MTYSGWNLYIYTDILSELTNLYGANVVPSPYIPVPFQRPCKKICTDVADSCLGLLGLIGLDQNCSTRYDYSFGALSSLYAAFPSLPKPYQYDASNNAAVCNAMNVSFAVASTKEPYLHALDPNGACYGITSELWVPPANLLDPSLASMQPPYVVQTMIEGQLADNFKALPAWLSKRCHLALRKYFCGSYMLAPSPQVVRQVFNDNGFSNNVLFGLTYAGYVRASLLSYEFFLPSYPHVSVCEEYVSACGDFVSLAGIAALVPNCSAQTGSIKDFPSANQTIQSLPLSLGPYHSTILFRTPPNSMASATTEAYTTRCPDGYVVPNKEDPRTTWVPGTGCAVSCKVPVWTKEEWRSISILNAVLAWTGFPLLIFLIMTWTLDKERKKQYLVVCFATFSSIATLSMCAVTLIPFEDAFCATNAVPYDESDGATFCAVQSMMFVFSGLGTAASWTMLSLDLFLKVVLGFRHTSIWRRRFLILIISIPVTFMTYATQQSYGSAVLFPNCFVKPTHDLISVYVPMLILAVIGAICMVLVILRIAQSIRSTHVHRGTGGASQASLRIIEKFNMLRTPLIFTFLFFFVMATYETYKLQLSKVLRVAQSGLQDYSKCVFQNYDGTDGSWVSACGRHPKQRPDIVYLSWVFTCLVGQSLLLCFIYLISPAVWMFWFRRLGIDKLTGVTAAVVRVGPVVSRVAAGSVVSEHRNRSHVTEGGSCQSVGDGKEIKKSFRQIRVTTAGHRGGDPKHAYAPTDPKDPLSSEL